MTASPLAVALVSLDKIKEITDPVQDNLLLIFVTVFTFTAAYSALQIFRFGYFQSWLLSGIAQVGEHDVKVYFPVTKR